MRSLFLLVAITMSLLLAACGNAEGSNNAQGNDGGKKSEGNGSSEVVVDGSSTVFQSWKL